MPESAPAALADASPAPVADAVPNLTGVVETALARALSLAAEAQRWDVVSAIASELKARRENRNGRGDAEVVAIPVTELSDAEESATDRRSGDRHACPAGGSTDRTPSPPTARES